MAHQIEEIGKYENYRVKFALIKYAAGKPTVTLAEKDDRSNVTTYLGAYVDLQRVVRARIREKGRRGKGGGGRISGLL